MCNSLERDDAIGPLVAASTAAQTRCMPTTEAPSAPATMRAIVATSWGGPDVLQRVTVPRPEPGPTEILVAVHAAGVNPTDWKARASGGFGQWGDPPILGHDVSGVVEATGPGASLFAPGDEVFGMPHFPAAGAYAEYVTAPSRHFARKPAGLDHVHAAALPLVGLTAWQALAEVAQVQPGQRVLVHAAAGGVGHVAVQVAKALGAHVIGTASASKHDFVRSLGADELIDYRATDFADVLRDLDVVLDTIGGDYSLRSLAVLRRGGVHVALPRPTDPAVDARARELGVRTGWTLVEPDRAGLLAIAELVDAGKLRVEIAAVLPLADAARAHELGESNRTTGKLVLRVRG
jgi:NADPH:quinone reductase-like Zn-dependent oxidoreductase